MLYLSSVVSQGVKEEAVALELRLSLFVEASI